MTSQKSSQTTSSQTVRLQNDYGADYWVRNSQERRVRLCFCSPGVVHTYIASQHSTAGRGLFAGLQDVKHYNVDHGWARRKSGDAKTGLLGSIWSRYVHGCTCQSDEFCTNRLQLPWGIVPPSDSIIALDKEWERIFEAYIQGILSEGVGVSK